MRKHMKLAAVALLAASSVVAGLSGTAQAATVKPNPTGMVTDALGTHLAGLADAGGFTALATCPAHPYGGGFDTSMGAGWSQLAIRTGPCRAANAVGDHYTGEIWHVQRETSGEFICKGRSYGYGSTIWYQDSTGWSWSGGTSNPVWDKSC